MTSRTAIIAGATGLVGREILAGLLADPAVTAVHSLGRRGASGTTSQAHIPRGGFRGATGLGRS
jgi:hypothetical protein